MALLLALAALSCATPPAPPPVVVAPPPVDPEAEARAQAEARAAARRAREEELLDIVANANLIDMPSEDRERLRATSLQEVASLRLEGGVVADALEALGRARDAARFSGDPRVIAAVARTEFLVLHYAALQAAKAGDLTRSLELFDRISLLTPLSPADRQRAAGDRLALTEQAGDQGLDASSIDAALARLLGPEGSVDPTSPTAAVQTDEAIRQRLSAAVGREVAEARLPTAAAGVVLETGRFDPATVVRVVSVNKGSVAACYNQQIRSGSSEKGKLELRIGVAPTGEVTETEIMSPQFKTSPLGRCIADAVQRWRFPPFEGDPREVLIPFVLDLLR